MFARKRWGTMEELIVIQELKELEGPNRGVTLYETIRVCGFSIVAEKGSSIKEDSFYVGIRDAYMRGELFINLDVNEQLLTIANGKQRSFKISKEDVFCVAKILEDVKYGGDHIIKIYFRVMDDGREAWSIYFERLKNSLQLKIDDVPIPPPNSRRSLPKERFGSYRVGKKRNDTSILSYI